MTRRAKAGLAAWSLLATAPALRAEPTCSANFRVTANLQSGAVWDLCFEPRDLEGIVLSEIEFTPPQGAALPVLSELALAQVHVPYDDNGARFHDLTDYGLGGNELAGLAAGECAGGTRRNDGTGKLALCERVIAREDIFRAQGERAAGQALELWSVSHIGSYNYVPRYRFFDDGTIEVAIGATGQLQRTSGAAAAEHGWPLNAGNTVYGVSHLHNYYWRLDFDLGAAGDDDAVEEIEAAPSGDFARRSVSLVTFDVEMKRSIEPALARRWRVRDSATNSDGHPRSWEIEPLLVGQRDEGPAYEPFTKNDLYVTVHRACERFASHNPTFGGCGDDVSDFTNGEPLAGADVVLWYGVSFHHVPRDEDQSQMSVHWSSFRLVPRDVVATNPLAGVPANHAPEITPPASQTWAEGESVALAVTATDADGDGIVFSASGLPPGLAIDAATGEITGLLPALAQGRYPAALTASDGTASSQVLVPMTVEDGTAPGEIFDDTFETGDTSAWSN